MGEIRYTIYKDYGKSRLYYNYMLYDKPRTIRLSDETFKKLKRIKGRGKSWERYFMELTVKFKTENGVLKRLEPDGNWYEVIEAEDDDGYYWKSVQNEKLF